MNIDFLLVESEVTERTRLACALRALPDVRVSEASKGREAVTSLSRATFSAVVCPLLLEDIRASQLVGLIRGGGCGFPHTPIVVIADTPDLLALASGDPNTFYLRPSEPAVLAEKMLRLIVQRPRPSVLLIEDDLAYARYCAEFLQPFYNVDIRSDGRSGLAAWHAGQYDVILLDLMLPGMRGEDILRLISTEAPAQPVIVLTSNDGLSNHQDLVLSGAAAFLSKGSVAHLIAATIQDVLRDTQCLTLESSWRGERNNLRSLASRVYAAQFSLSRGQAWNATHHLSQALAICPVNGPSDDEWGVLLSDEGSSPGKTK
jgi:CheY-like chemotaxis protein